MRRYGRSRPSRDSAAQLGGNARRRVYLCAVGVDAFGSALYLPLGIVLLTEINDLSAQDASFGLGIAAVAGIATVPMNGVLLDRLRPSAAVFWTYMLRAGGYALMPLATSVPILVVASAVSRAGGQANGVALFHLASAIETDERQRVGIFGATVRARNVGSVAGYGTVAIVLSADSRPAILAALCVNVASFLVAGAAASGVTTVRHSRSQFETLPSYRSVLRDRRFIAFVCLFTLLSCQEDLMALGLPLWLRSEAGEIGFLLGGSFVVNSTLVVALQGMASRRAHKIPAMKRRLAYGGVLAGMGCVTFTGLASARGTMQVVLLVLLAVTLMSVGEVLFNSGSHGWLAVWPPEHNRHRYYSAFSLADEVSQVIAPLMILNALHAYPGGAWIFFGVVLAAAGLICSVVIRPTRDSEKGS